MAGRGVGNRGIMHFTSYRSNGWSGKMSVGEYYIGEYTLHPIIHKKSFKNNIL
jgi:hypothetical protein